MYIYIYIIYIYIYTICVTPGTMSSYFMSTRFRDHTRLYFSYNGMPLEWYICYIYNSSAINMSPVSDMLCNVFGDIYGWYMTLRFDIHIYDMIAGFMYRLGGKKSPAQHISVWGKSYCWMRLSVYSPVLVYCMCRYGTYLSFHRELWLKNYVTSIWSFINL